MHNNLFFFVLDSKMESVILFVPKSAQVVNGSCANDTQFIMMSWASNIQGLSHGMTLNFNKIVNKTDFALGGVEFNLIMDDHFENAKGLYSRETLLTF